MKHKLSKSDKIIGGHHSHMGPHHEDHGHIKSHLKAEHDRHSEHLEHARKMHDRGPKHHLRGE